MTTPLTELESIQALATDIGVVSSAVVAGGNSLNDQSKMWVDNVHVNRLVKIVKGPGAGQSAWIRGNSATSLIVRGAWVQAIGPGAIYVILDQDTTSGFKGVTQIMNLANLAAGATSVIGDCTSVDMRHGPLGLALTVVATYNAAAVAGLRFHVRTSPDNVNWDTEDWDAWNAGFTAGATIRETEHYDTSPMFLRVLIENLDLAQAITNITIASALGA